MKRPRSLKEEYAVFCKFAPDAAYLETPFDRFASRYGIGPGMRLQYVDLVQKYRAERYRREHPDPSPEQIAEQEIAKIRADAARAMGID